MRSRINHAMLVAFLAVLAASCWHPLAACAAGREDFNQVCYFGTNVFLQDNATNTLASRIVAAGAGGADGWSGHPATQTVDMAQQILSDVLRIHITNDTGGWAYGLLTMDDGDYGTLGFSMICVGKTWETLVTDDSPGNHAYAVRHGSVWDYSNIFGYMIRTNMHVTFGHQAEDGRFRVSQTNGTDVSCMSWDVTESNKGCVVRFKTLELNGVATPEWSIGVNETNPGAGFQIYDDITTNFAAYWEQGTAYLALWGDDVSQDPDSRLDIKGGLTIRELSADPADPDEGASVMWLSDGTGYGDDGDLIVKITAGGTTTTNTLVNHSDGGD